MDGLEAQEIEGIWKRVKHYLDLSQITAADLGNMASQLSDTMNIKTSGDGRTEQGNMDFLRNRGFPDRAVNDPRIRNELLATRIQEIKINGKTRFQTRAGTRDGKALGGTLLKGQTLSEAIGDLSAKAAETKPARRTYKRKMGY